MAETDSILLVPCSSDGKKKLPSVKGWFEIDNKPLRIDTVLFIGDFDRFKKELKKRRKIELMDIEAEDVKTNDGMTIPITDAEGRSFVAIWTNGFNWTLDDMETLSHECLHASIMVMRASGVRAKLFDALTDEEVDDEQLAYISSSMFTNFLDKLIRKQHKEIRNMMKR